MYVTDFDVKGEVGKTYSIISDRNIQFNATFAAGDPTIGTIMGQMGIKLREDDGTEHRFEFDALTGVAKYNDTQMTAGQKQTLTINGQQATVEFKDGKLFVETPEYSIELMQSPDGNHGDQKIRIKNGGVLTDWVNPHGLLGQTADGDQNIRKGTGINGEGAIDWNYKKYEIQGGLFGDPDSQINRYGVDLVKTIENGKVTRLRTQDGTLTATLDQNGNLVSVRYVEQPDGSIKMFLADGTTEIDHNGNIINQ